MIARFEKTQSWHRFWQTFCNVHFSSNRNALKQSVSSSESTFNLILVQTLRRKVSIPRFPNTSHEESSPSRVLKASRAAKIEKRKSHLKTAKHSQLEKLKNWKFLNFNSLDFVTFGPCNMSWGEYLQGNDY